MIPEIMIKIIIFAYGLCVGSFLNVCIYRIPKRKSIAFPASHCPKCKAKIPWYYNVPVISYVVLRGKCSNCKENISICYPIVEFITGLSALALYIHFQTSEHNILLAVFYFIFVAALIVITTIDLRYYIIPDVISLPGIILGMIFSFIVPEMQGELEPLNGLLFSFVSALSGGGILLMVALIGTWIFKKEAMGMGDIKLVAMFGAFIGIKLTLLSIFFSSVLGSIAGVSFMLLGKAKMQSRIPFGPYLAAGAVISIFYGSFVISKYIAFVTRGM
ncbi:MAG: prepilin peptidase [Candidatus Aureabacteria bacterium]|nr:prepilin peptidase [Candidatus Auribacterota bacterium]